MAAIDTTLGRVPAMRRDAAEDTTASTPVGPATPNGHRNSSADWRFPFPNPGRWEGKKKIPANTELRQPWVDVDAYDATRIAPRFVRSPVGIEAVKEHIRTYADDVGVISIDHPALAHELKEIRYVYPHVRSLIVLVAESNKPSMQSRYLPTANHELYETEDRLFQWNHRTIRYLKSIGGEGLTTTIGWPQEVSQRWPDKIWPLSHKLVAQAAGLGVIGTSRNFLHRKFGAYCLLDTVLTNLEFEEPDYTQSEQQLAWNPCIECNLCVASCPTEAIKSDGEFDFMACYNHTYRDSIPGFLDFARDLAEGKPRRFEHRWSDAEIAALWQSMAFRVEYRCFNCVATCPAEIHETFHSDRKERARYFSEALKPLTRTRSEVEERFVIDTPSARDRYDIEPGSYRTPPDPTKPGQRVVRLVQLHRMRATNVDTMMRMMAHMFRPEEAGDLDFTCQYDFDGDGGGKWGMRIADQRCNMWVGNVENPDLTIRCDGRLYLGIQQGDVNPVVELLRGRIRLSGKKELFLAFPRLFPMAPPREGLLARLLWRLRRARRRRLAARAARR